jgi:acetyl esterase
MALDPDVAELVEALAASGAPPLSGGSVEEARHNYLAASRPAPDPLPHVIDVEFPGSTGPISVRVYSAVADPTALPILLFAHGGGWVLSSVAGHDHLARRLALETGALVVSVEYRLAPEHPFPAPHDDCWDVLHHLRSAGQHYGGDPDRIVVCGDSAGANLAAGVAIRARDEGMQLCGQVLVYPCLDDRSGQYPSMTENATGYFLTAADMAWFWNHYLPDSHRNDPRAVPARCNDLSGLTQTLVVTAEYDPLRDEGLMYSKRLASAGVDVTEIPVPGVVHGFLARWHTMSRANETLRQVGDYVRRITA